MLWNKGPHPKQKERTQLFPPIHSMLVCKLRAFSSIHTIFAPPLQTGFLCVALAVLKLER